MAGKVITTSRAPAPLLSRSAQAVAAGPFLFLSAQGGADPEGGHYRSSIEAQAEATLENLAAVLEAAGTSLDQALERTVYLANRQDVVPAYTVLDSLFPSPVASTTIQGGRLMPERLLEIDLIAALPSLKKELVTTPRAPKPLVKSSAQGVKASPFLFATGQGGRKPEAPPGQYLSGLEAQVEQALANSSAILEAGGSSLERALTATTYLDPGEDLAAAEAMLGRRLGSALLQVKMLISGKVTIENVIALLPGLEKEPLSGPGAWGARAGPWLFVHSEGPDLEHALSQASALLQRAGASLEQALRLKLYLAGRVSLAQTEALWEKLPFPAASSLIPVEGLPKGARVALGLVAYGG